VTALLEQLARAPGMAGAELPALRPGRVIGRFEVVRELGCGGFGRVYEARDRELGRSVAFKLLRASARPELREERLFQEAEAAARLAHPNIVTLHDVGRAEEGPYLVLELLRGHTLAERLERGPMPPREALRTAVEIAKGLAHAHAHGVTHRDLTPRNVYLCDDGQVKVLDFGMAHAFGRRKMDGGTRAYMAPEQARGAPEDERTDVFALGVLLHEMLSGELPFEDDAALASPEPPPPLEVRGAPALRELVGRMLEKDPVDRPRDAGEALDGLSAAMLALEQTPSRGHAELQAGRRSRRPVAVVMRHRRRGRWLAVLGAIAVVAASVGLGWNLLHRDRSSLPVAGRASPRPGEDAAENAPRRIVVLPLVNLSGDAAQEYFSDGMTEEITSRLSRLAGLAVTSRTSANPYKGSPRSAREIGAELAVAYLVEGSVRRAGDRIRVTASLVRTADAVRLWSEDLDARFDDVFSVQERIASRIVEALGVTLSPREERALRSWGTRNAAAYDEYLRGMAKFTEDPDVRANVDAATTHFERAIAIDADFAPALAGLAACEAMIYRNWESRPDRLQRAEALVGKGLALDPQLVPALKAAADIRGYRFDYAGAAEQFRRITALTPRDHVIWDQLCWALGYVLPPALEEAESACRRAIALEPGYGPTRYHLLRVHVLSGRPDAAETDLLELERISPGTVLGIPARYWLAMGRGRPAEALRALEGRNTNLDQAWRAAALARLGRKEQAFAALAAALAGGYRDVADLRGSPWYEPLRRDPRWEATLARHGLAP
jgi:TolB-like protein